jgi:ribonuclease J
LSQRRRTIGAMKVRIHRGANEIGGSCVEVESSNQRILIDAGMPLNLPANATLSAPQIDASSLCAVLISHPHQDHYGLLPWVHPAPVAMGATARRMLKTAAPFLRQRPISLDGPDFVHRQAMQIGPFRVTPYLVDHSAYDAYALLIEADGRRLYYSGDIRMHGRKRGLVEQLIASPPSDIAALLLEGTTLGRIGQETRPLSESDLEDKFERVFKETAGLALVHTSGQNIDRLVTIFRACIKTNRTLVVDLYTALILEATGNRQIPQSDWHKMALAIPQRQRIQIKRNGWFEALARHSANRIYVGRHIAKSPEKYALVFRSLWMPDLERAGCLAGACLIHSQWEGYLKAPAFVEIDSWRKRHGMPFHQIHTSGHASPQDLRRFALAIAPEVLVPIHSAAPELFEDICPNVVRHPDNEWWAV